MNDIMLNFNAERAEREYRMKEMIRKQSPEYLSEVKWNKRFLELAIFISEWSKDPSSKVGAVIVDENRRIVSTGYNGFPIGVHDDKDRLDTKEVKYKMVLHAEENAIMFAKRDLSRCSLYVSKIPPCSHCAGLIIQSGIKNVYVQTCEIADRWRESFEYSKMMFRESDVKLHFINLNEIEKSIDTSVFEEPIDHHFGHPETQNGSVVLRINRQ